MSIFNDQGYNKLNYRNLKLERHPVHLYVLMMLNLILPVSNNTLRIAIYILFAVVSFFYILKTKNFVYTKWSFIAGILSVSVGIIWSLYGILQNNPGAIFSLGIYLIWPIFFVLFAGQIVDGNVARALHKLIVAFSILIGLFVANFILIQRGVLPDNLLNKIDLGQAIVFYEGYTEMRLYTISSLVFVIPYMISYILCSSSRILSKDKIYTFIGVLSGLFVVLAAGRRALFVNMILAPIILLILTAFVSSNVRKRMRKGFIYASLLSPFLIPLVLWLSIFLGLNLSGLTGYLATAFQPTVSGEAQVRFEQTLSLIQNWMSSPLIGYGLGAATEYVRSERSWEYEAQYPMLLFQTGLIGFSVYVTSILAIYYYGLKAVSKADRSLSPIVMSSLVGLSSLLIANASNPYIQAFGHLWMIFLPIGLINMVHMQRTRVEG